MRLLRQFCMHNRLGKLVDIRLFTNNSGLIVFDKHIDYSIMGNIEHSDINAVNPRGGPYLPVGYKFENKYEITQFVKCNENSNKSFVQFRYKTINT